MFDSDYPTYRPISGPATPVFKAREPVVDDSLGGQIRQKRAYLQEVIESLVDEFERNTGVAVDNISMSRWNYYPDSPYFHDGGVSLKPYGSTNYPGRRKPAITVSVVLD